MTEEPKDRSGNIGKGAPVVHPARTNGIQRLFRLNLGLMVLVDAVLVLVCYAGSYLVRFEFSVPPNYGYVFRTSVLFVVVLKMLTFAAFHLYRGMWRYTSLVDLLNVLKAVFFSSMVIILAVLLLKRFEGYPRSVFFIDATLTFLAVGGVRVIIRLFFAWRVGVDIAHLIRRRTGKGKRLLIIGAGDAGEKLLREIRDNPGLKFDPVGFLDDQAGKHGKAIHGVPVLGGVDDVKDLAVEFDEILIAVPSAKGDEMRRIVAACEMTGKRYRTIPGIGELIGGKLSLKTIREVTVEDLLGREEVRLDQEGIARYLKQKRVLVTGAGGSIGSELVRQICRFSPRALGLVEVSELNLFRVEMECRQRFGYVDVAGFLVDLRRKEALERAFRQFRPQVVFHAAAYKHVPIQELHPWEAVYNNVLGTRNLVEAALTAKVERFVLVSTDKAVRPTNVMGSTKRVAEMFVECFNGAGDPACRMMAVRFGNVLGSSGSAIPLFREQIERGGPVTVTHPEVSRYFMSIPEAAQLILQAGAMGEGGEIFLLEMGRPVKILDLARDLIRLHGLEPDRDIPIHFIGLRPGEKLYEELITEGEGIVQTTHEKILVLRGGHCEPADLNRQIDELLEVARTYDCAAVKRKLRQIVPEYTPQW
jgi:FlaA1/EpsC-like NDP-sugar epimerase